MDIYIIMFLPMYLCISTDISVLPSNPVACGQLGSEHWLQGFRVGSYDVLLATNAIPAQHAATALQNCKALLRADGLLAVTEPTAKTEVFSLTIDMASGWWLHDANTDQLAGSSIISRYASHTYMHDHLSNCR